VADEGLPRDAELNEVSAKLNEGLKSCRAVIADYRPLLADEKSDSQAASTADPLQSGPRLQQPQ
jgi:hypothetical protein